MVISTRTVDGVYYIFGACWPHGRSRAVDDAQIRVSLRDLDALASATETKTENE